MALKRQMLDFARDVLKARRLTAPLERRALRLVELLAPARRARKNIPHPTRPPPAMTTAEIAAAVRDRAAGICEACGRQFTGRDPFSLDHWENGIGRRKQKESVQNCWGLHRYTCHRDRQEYRIPAWASDDWRSLAGQVGAGVVFWNDRFGQHCERQRPPYPFQPHIEHQPIRRRA